MNFKIGISAIDETQSFNIIPFPIPETYAIEFFTEDMILKKRSVIGKNRSILDGSYEIDEKGSLNASITVMNFDTHLSYNDIVRISYKGKIEYIGFITQIPEYESGIIKIDSFLNKLDNDVYIGDFESRRIKEILQTIITQSVIKWDNDLVNIDDESYYTVSYASIKLKKIIEDWAELEPNKFYGITTDLNFYVRLRDDFITRSIYPKQYEKLSYKKNYTKIKYTRVDLYRSKNDSDPESAPDDIFVSEIPDGSSLYPYFEIENEIGIIKDKKNAPSELNEEESKRWAYGEVQAQIKPVESLDITGLIRNIQLRPGQKIRVYDNPKKIFKNYDISNLNQWSGNVYSDLGYKNQDGILITGDTTFSFDEPLYFLDNIKIIFYFKSNFYGKIGEIYTNPVSSYLTDDQGNILTDDQGNLFVASGSQLIDEIRTSNINTWCYFEKNINAKRLNFIEFNYLEDFTISNLIILGYNSKYYELNVINLSFDISRDSLNKYNVKLGSYDKTVNDIQFEMKRLIEKRG